MKKIFYLLLLLTSLLLVSCSGKQTSNNTTGKKSSKITVNKKIDTQNQLKTKNESKGKESEVSKNKQEENKLSSNEGKLAEIKHEYIEKLKNLESMGSDEYSKLQILVNANCTGVCNLDMKDNLSSEDLKVAQACYKTCITRQKQAKQKLEQFQKQLAQEKAQYPKKCFQDAEEDYKKQQEMFKQSKTLPKGYKQPSKEKIIQSDANRCLLMYGYLNYNCEKIKKYKQPYEQCKRIMQLQQDLQFIQNWQYKSFDDYLRQKNKGF